MRADLFLVQSDEPLWFQNLPDEIRAEAGVAVEKAVSAVVRTWRLYDDWKVTEQWTGLVRGPDLHGEAWSLLLSKRDLRECLEHEEGPKYGRLRSRLKGDLNELVGNHRNQHTALQDDNGEMIRRPVLVSFDQRNETFAEMADDDASRAVTQGRNGTNMHSTSTYDVDQVEWLAPTIANLMHYDGLMGETAPDRDMPAGKRSPATGGNLLVSAIDVRRAWKHAPLTPKQREAFRLYYVHDPRRGDRNEDVRFVDVGKAMGCSGEVARRRIDAAMRKLLTFLNGVESAEAVAKTGELEVAA